MTRNQARTLLFRRHGTPYYTDDFEDAVNTARAEQTRMDARKAALDPSFSQPDALHSQPGRLTESGFDREEVGG
jgi:hypothetical protein